MRGAEWISFDQLDLNDRACMAYQRHTRKHVPLRPILSMTGSAQHQLVKYLSVLLEPVLSLYSSNCIRDSFTFANAITTSKLNPSSVFLCSFDISSPFTNMPLAETFKFVPMLFTIWNTLLLPSPAKLSSN